MSGFQPQSLYVAYRSGPAEAGHWGPVGMLERIEGGWRFRYTQGARTLPGFHPFYEFPKLDGVYRSVGLFPLFANRLMNPRRPEYQSWLNACGLDPAEPLDPVLILGITNGRRATDNVELFARPQPDSEGCYVNRFFVHGVRWMSSPADAAIAALRPGDPLAIMPDPMNPVDPDAVAVRPMEGEFETILIGYVPRYLAIDIACLMQKCRDQLRSLTVVRVNLDAPSQQRLLCELRTCWPSGFAPCHGDAYDPIVSDDELPKRAELASDLRGNVAETLLADQ